MFKWLNIIFGIFSRKRRTTEEDFSIKINKILTSRYPTKPDEIKHKATMFIAD